MSLSPRFLARYFSAVCLGFSLSAAAYASGDEWRAIDPSELALKTSLVEKDADAEALFWEVRVDDSQRDGLTLKHYVRIKVFTDRGKESQSKVDLTYLGSTKIKDIAARVIKPDGTIVELKKEDVFERTLVKASGVKYKAKSFAIPGIEPGAIVEYRWQEVHPGRSANHLRLQFQRDIPVETVDYYLKPFRGMRYAPFHMGEARFVKDKDGFFKLSMSNMPAVPDEPRTPPEDEVRSWVLLYFSDDSKLDPDKYWTEYGKRVFEGTRDLMKVDDEVKKAVSTITGDAVDAEEKLRRIYAFCRTRIKNVNDDALGLTDDDRKKIKDNKSPADTLKQGIGTGLDINLLFAALAKAAAFDARVALSGNRNDLFFQKNLANAYFLASSFIAVKVNERWGFFSPAARYTAFGMLGWPEEGEQALLIDPKEPEWVKTPMSAPEKSLEKRTGKFTLLEDGTLEGDVRMEFSGHLGSEKKEYNDDDSQSQREETLRNSIKARLSTAEISDIKVENVTDPDKPFVYAYHVKVPGYAQRSGKRLFLQPGYFTRGFGVLFSATERKTPIYFHYPWAEQDDITITLPDGFVFDNADAPAPIAAEKICLQRIAISSDGKILLYKRSFFFGGGDVILFPATSYPALKQLFDIIHRANDHTITLKQSAAGPAK